MSMRWNVWMLGGWVALVACTPKSEQVGDVDTEGSEDSGSDGSGGSDEGTAGAACSAEVVESRDTFESLVASAGDVYHYAVYGRECIEMGDFDCDVACDWKTELEVSAGVVVRRRLTLPIPPMEGECTGVPFDEVGDALGSHDDPFVAPLRTVAELYASCCEQVFGLQSEFPGSTPRFQTDEAGVIELCFLETDECAESCDLGPAGVISLASFGVGPLP